MKKLFVALCAVAALSMVACKKDNPQPSNPGGSTPTEQPRREGEFNPTCKISTITFSDNSAPEMWFWDENTGLLSTINNDDLCGGYTEKARFTYDSDGRVSTVTLTSAGTESIPLLGSLSGTMSVEYDGDYISSLSLVNAGERLLTADVKHDGDKVRGATLNLSDNMLVDLFNSAMAQFLGESATGDMVTSVDSVSGKVAFVWNGKNVSQALLNIDFRAGTTLGVIRQIMGDDMSMFGEYAQYLAFLPDNMPLFFTVSMGDTVNYTYDDKSNPYRGFLGRVHISTLTENNVTTEEHVGSATVAIATSIMNSMVQIYQTSMPLPLPMYFYQYDEYNDKGFPLSMTDTEGVVSRFEYKQ